MNTIKHYLRIKWMIIPLIFFSCSKEKLNDSIINTNTPFLSQTDIWLRKNYTTPYNMEILYKWNDGETTMGKNLIPIKEEIVIPLMLTLDSIWKAPYIRAGGLSFFKRLAPKQIMLIGSPSINPDEGTITQGTAEGGRKIVLYSGNWFNPKSRSIIWENYIHVIFHEFGHIMHQTVNYNIEFKKITPTYTSAWTAMKDMQAQQVGFITAYARSNSDEDFVETMSIFLTTTPASWDATMASIKDGNAQKALQSKLNLIIKYMRDVWHIDAYALRTDVNASFDKLTAN